MCQSGKISQALVGINPTVLRANSSPVCRDSSQGPSGVRGNRVKPRLHRFCFDVAFQEEIATFVISRGQCGCKQTKSGASFHFIGKEISAFQHHLLCHSLGRSQ